MQRKNINTPLLFLVKTRRYKNVYSGFIAQYQMILFGAAEAFFTPGQP